MSKQRKLWSVPRIGHPRYPGWLVRVTELEPGGILHAVRMENGKQRMASMRIRRTDLGKSEKEQVEGAKARALEVVEALAEGKSLEQSTWPERQPTPEVLTVGALVDRFESRGLLGRSKDYRRDTFTQLRWIAQFLGRDRRVVSLSRSDVEALSAALKAEGRSQGTVAGYADSLKRACRWALDENGPDGRPVLEHDPLARVRIEQERSPHRPWATQERYEALKKVADQFPAEFELALDLAWHTGRRISAILHLKWQDIHFEESKEAPYGAITWYAGMSADNKKYEAVVPMNTQAREAIDRFRERRPGLGEAWVFPAVRDPSRPLVQDLAAQWLAKAEKAAKLQHERGGGWHMFRRGWSTVRKHLPLKDLAAAGGWRDTATLLASYQQVDAATLLSVVNGG